MGMNTDSSTTSSSPLSFVVLGQRVRVDCIDPTIRQVVVANFGARAAGIDDLKPDLHYRIDASGTPPGFALSRDDQTPYEGEHPGDLLYVLEKDLTVELQKRRSDLLFLHSAAIEWHGNACLLASESGGGKSTLTWALLHHGFGYLSDELSPIDLDSMQVFPYSHALCLKRRPSPPYGLPEAAIELGRTLHVPVASMPGTTVSGARPVAAVFLVSYVSGTDPPAVRAVGHAEASARLYVSALNALAHSNHGLDAVVRIAQRVPCFAIASAELGATCELVRSTLERATHQRVESAPGP
jgi:hypothetical protein